jgi:hypothetical protein
LNRVQVETIQLTISLLLAGAYDPVNPAHKGRNIAVGEKLDYNSPYGAGKGNPGLFPLP